MLVLFHVLFMILQTFLLLWPKIGVFRNNWIYHQ